MLALSIFMLASMLFQLPSPSAAILVHIFHLKYPVIHL